MKTKLTLAFIFLLLNAVLLSGGNINPSYPGNDTLAITRTMVSLPMAEDESYINDIPFDTRVVALKSLYNNLAKPEAETYINDIPFDTYKVVNLLKSSIKDIHPEEEAYVDDIPFNTADVVSDYGLKANNKSVVSDKVKLND
ncbi:MAG: hypothetical protein WCQ70_06155 [Lentimicrobiaceae bacterium]